MGRGKLCANYLLLPIFISYKQTVFYLNRGIFLLMVKISYTLTKYHTIFVMRYGTYS